MGCAAAAPRRRAARLASPWVAEPRSSSSACAFCHAVRGTPAGGNAGPDLTHVAGRRTLAAGLLPNTPGHLGGWIGNPQALKPGSRMPQVPMSPEKFRLIHRYLRSLE